MAIWRVRIACWIPNATNTHSEYVTLNVIPLQQWLPERASMVCCTYITCLVFSKAYRPALEPTQDPLPRVQGSLFPGVKRQEREADYWPPYSIRVNIDVVLRNNFIRTAVYYSPLAFFYSQG